MLKRSFQAKSAKSTCLYGLEVETTIPDNKHPKAPASTVRKLKTLILEKKVPTFTVQMSKLTFQKISTQEHPRKRPTLRDREMIDMAYPEDARFTIYAPENPQGDFSMLSSCVGGVVGGCTGFVWYHLVPGKAPPTLCPPFALRFDDSPAFPACSRSLFDGSSKFDSFIFNKCSDIYSFHIVDDNEPEYLFKVGRTSWPLGKRQVEWDQQCLSRPHIWYDRVPVKHLYRVKRLVHLALMARRMERVRKQCPDCRKYHQEVFRLPSADAWETIIKPLILEIDAEVEDRM
uniref:Bacteriophage T5 Orf172 DNA-binding domain-containing protein n=1 Tax=Moniliophthora roreri TaxID=221103 RepID=A0A0W0F621_MONRR